MQEKKTIFLSSISIHEQNSSPKTQMQNISKLCSQTTSFPINAKKISKFPSFCKKTKIYMAKTNQNQEEKSFTQEMNYEVQSVYSQKHSSPKTASTDAINGDQTPQFDMPSEKNCQTFFSDREFVASQYKKIFGQGLIESINLVKSFHGDRLNPSENVNSQININLYKNTSHFQFNFDQILSKDRNFEDLVFPSLAKNETFRENTSTKEEIENQKKPLIFKNDVTCQNSDENIKNILNSICLPQFIDFGRQISRMKIKTNSSHGKISKKVDTSIKGGILSADRRIIS